MGKIFRNSLALALLLLHAAALMVPAPAKGAACGPLGSPYIYMGDLTRLDGFSKIAVHPSGDIYVADFKGDSVKVYDRKGALLHVIPVASPSAIAVDPSGTAYVGQGSSIIAVTIDPEKGVVLRKLVEGAFSHISDMAVTADGRLFILEAKRHRVWVYRTNGSYLAQFGYGTLFMPMGLDVDEAGGKIIVSDRGNYKIRIYDLNDYTLLHSFGQVQTDGNDWQGKFNFLTGVAADGEGRIFVLDDGPDRVQIFDGCYTYLDIVGGHGTGSGELNMPVDIATDAYGRIFVSSVDGRISIFRSADTRDPSPLSPADGAVLLTGGATLTVNNGYINGAPLTYEFELARDELFTDVVASDTSVTEGAATTTWKTPALSDNATYYWRARGSDGLGYTGWSTPYSLRTNSLNISERGEELVSEGLPGNDENPSLAVDEERGTLWMAWQGDSNGSYGIYVRAFDIIGGTWGETTLISTGASDRTSPALAVIEGEGLRLAWTEDGRINTILFDYSTGLWSGQTVVSGSLTNCANPEFAVDSSTGGLVITWDADYDASRGVFISRYDRDLGLWEDPQPVSVAGDRAVRPAPAFDSAGRLWIAWEGIDSSGGGDIYYRTNDPATGWSGVTAFAATSADERSARLAATESGDVWLVYLAGGTVTTAEFDGSGLQWKGSTPFASGGAASNPDIISDHSGKVWVLWDAVADGNRDLYMALLDGTWSTPMRLTSEVSRDMKPALSLYMNRIWLAWESDRNGDMDVFTMSFFVDDLPSAPMPLAPDDGDVTAEISPALSVSPADDPDSPTLSYHFELDSTPGFDSPDLVRSGALTGSAVISWQPGQLRDETTYYWRARAYDGEGFGPWSETRRFTIITTNYPPVITSQEPSGQSQTVRTDTSLLFAVTASDANNDPLEYTWLLDGIEVSKATTFTFDPSLEDIGNHTLEVRVGDGFTSTSAAWTLIVVRPNTAPTPPAPNAPVEGEVADSRPVLSINNSSDAEGDSLTYTFEVNATGDFSPANTVAIAYNVPEGSNTTSVRIGVDLNENTTYHWRARSFDGEFYSTWSASASFFVNRVNDRPAAPGTGYPAGGTEVPVRTPVLTAVNAFDADLDTLSYDFEVAADEGFGTIVAAATAIPEGPGSTSWTVDRSLEDSTRYYWRVRAVDEHGRESAWASTSFVVNTSNNAPTTPVVAFPADKGETTTTPTLRVYNSTDADDDTLVYIFEVDVTDRFNSGKKQVSPPIAGGDGITSWTVEHPLEDNKIHFLRVKANDGSADSPWSATVSFFTNIANEPPTAPAVKAPAGGVEVNSGTPTLEIYPASDPDGDKVGYTYQVATDSLFADIVEESDIAGTSWTIKTGLDENRTYYWRVKAVDEHGLAGGWSDTGRFVVNRANDPPTAPVIGWRSFASGADIVLEIGNSTDSDGLVRTYSVEVYSDRDLTDLVYSEEGIPEDEGKTYCTVGMLDDGIYFWRARAMDENGAYSGWSGTRVFRVGGPGDDTGTSADESEPVERSEKAYGRKRF